MEEMEDATHSASTNCLSRPLYRDGNHEIEGRGTTVTQVDEPFSTAMSNNLCRGEGRVARTAMECSRMAIDRELWILHFVHA